MAPRKGALKAVGLFDKSPIQAVPAQEAPEGEIPGRKSSEGRERVRDRRQRAAVTRDETLYTFSFRLRLDQRQALDEVAQESRRPTAPGKVDASKVLREILDAWMEKR